jgi:hypothetical protein
MRVASTNSIISEELSTPPDGDETAKKDDTNGTFRPATLSDAKTNILTYLLNIDFSKHVDLLELVNLDGFEVTDEEEDFNCTTSHCLKLVKIMLYQMGMQEKMLQRNYDMFVEDVDIREKE